MNAPIHVSHLAVNVMDPTSLLSAFGALGILVVLFAETGLMIGFFLPGDSLLFTAGLLTTTTANSAIHLSLPWVLLAAAAGALLGAQTGYYIGRRSGPAVIGRIKNPKLHHGIKRSGEILDQYGHAKAIVLARFIPVVRTVLNPMAGALGVPPKTFALWQVLGGLLWSVGVTLAGHALGSSIPNIDNYLLPIIGLIVVLSLIPVALEIRKAHRAPAAQAREPEPAAAPGKHRRS
jgi:membrane-associated protein